MNDPLNKTSVNHIDSNKRNNIPSNLEWVTPYDKQLLEIKERVQNIKIKIHHQTEIRIMEWNSNEAYKAWENDGYKVASRKLQQELERVKEDLRVETNVRKSFEKAFERVKAENKDQIKTILEFRQIESDYISECLEKAAEIERLKLIISGKYLLINGKEVL